MNILASLLSLLIAIYGLLFIVGGPPLANRLPDWLCRRLAGIVQAIVQKLMDLARGLAASIIRFVFYRPRR